MPRVCSSRRRRGHKRITLSEAPCQSNETSFNLNGRSMCLPKNECGTGPDVKRNGHGLTSCQQSVLKRILALGPADYTSIFNTEGIESVKKIFLDFPQIQAVMQLATDQTNASMESKMRTFRTYMKVMALVQKQGFTRHAVSTCKDESLSATLEGMVGNAINQLNANAKANDAEKAKTAYGEAKAVAAQLCIMNLNVSTDAFVKAMLEQLVKAGRELGPDVGTMQHFMELAVVLQTYLTTLNGG